MKRQIAIIGLWIATSMTAWAQDIDVPNAVAIIDAAAQAETETDVAKPKEKKVSKGLMFFYRVGDWVDHFLLKGVDTNYVALPEHSWRVAYTNAMVGIHSTMSSYVTYYASDGSLHNISISLVNKTIPSVDLGFYAGYRGFGFGYSWDAMNAYSRRLSFSLGSKSMGLDFSLQTSANIATTLAVERDPIDDFKNQVTISNASLSLWYALNAAHYSHQAAVKQSYIQKKTAGSLLLQLSYMSSYVGLGDSVKNFGGDRPVLASMMNNLTSLQTRQVAVGIGYGINYTPNHGKVVLHASANALLVAYSVNLVSYYLPDSIENGLPDRPMYNLNPKIPVHVTGNMRAAVSWEINKWVHLAAWANVENIRFNSALTANENYIRLSNWNWKVQANIGVRFGAGRNRLERALAKEKNLKELVNGYQTEIPKKSRFPEWLTGYFWSPKY